MTRRLANLLGFLACVALIAYALYSEHVLNLPPCPLCIFQRVAVIAMGVVFLIAGLHNPRGWGLRAYGALLVVTTLAGIGVAGRHIWIQTHPDDVPPCGAPLNHLLEINPVWEVVKKVLTSSGECAMVNWTFLGLSMPWWVVISLVVLG